MEVILHIPHSSTLIPDGLNRHYSDFEHAIECAEILVDHGTAELNKIVTERTEATSVVFPYSRVFCDVERFDSEEEEMNSVGMGVIYTHSHLGKEIRHQNNFDAIKKYYREHHEELNRRCAQAIEKDGQVLFVDVHSFAEEALPYELHKELERPDICIGYEPFHLTIGQIRILINTVESFGYTVSVNQPFIGCLIPGDYYLKDTRVQGFMFEMNKRLLPEIERVGELLIKMIENIK